MKQKILVIGVAVLSVFALTGCEEEFNPFDFNNLDIISSQESFYIDSTATNNLLHVSNVEKKEISRLDETSFYSGSASSYASYRENITESSIQFYSNRGYSNSEHNKTTLGNGLSGRYYSETINNTDEWISKDASSPSDYLLYTVNQYNNPQSDAKPTISSSTSLFATADNYDIMWTKKCLDLVCDGYSYSDFKFGSRDGNIYAFEQSIVESVVTNPLVSGENIITYEENMRVRHYIKHETLGWVISYSATKQNLYYATSMTGEVFDDPLLVEENQVFYRYTYNELTSNAFVFLQSDVLLNYQPLLFSYTPVEGVALDYTNPTASEQLDIKYLPRSDKDADLFYCSCIVTLRPENYYLLGMDIDNKISYYDYSFIDIQGNFTLSVLDVDSAEFFTSHFPVKLYLVISLLEDGNIHTVQAYYWSTIIE